PEIETHSGTQSQSRLGSVASGLASRLRLKHIIQDNEPWFVAGRQWIGFSPEIETDEGTMRRKALRGRQWIGFSPEIETCDRRVTSRQERLSPVDWLLA